jgi:hypothetical protein
MSADNQKKLDMALDDISKSERVGLKDSSRRRRGGGRRGGAGGKSTTTQNHHPIDLGSKILVSNLHFGVTESDLRVFFFIYIEKCVFIIVYVLYRSCSLLWGH